MSHEAPADDAQVLEWLRSFDTIDLTTVGFDIGSTTSHLMVSRVELHRRGTSLSSRYEVVRREILHESPVRLTPYTDDPDRIDLAKLHGLFERTLASAGLSVQDIDTGAVILTGLALQRHNSRRIGEWLADNGGAFVCATAGHRFEALLAAHGSGAVSASESGGAVLNVDVGGGTTKLALATAGRVVQSAAIAAGARLLSFTSDGAVERIEPTGRHFLREAGIDAEPGQFLDASQRRRLADSMAAAILATAGGRPPPGLVLAGSAQWPAPPSSTVFSGGVSEYMFERSTIDYGDLGPELGAALRARLDQFAAPSSAADGIRATVAGASQYSVQVSGNTIHVSRPGTLPLRNARVALVEIPVGANRAEVEAGLETAIRDTGAVDMGGTIALAIHRDDDPHYQGLRLLAEAIRNVHERVFDATTPLAVVFDQDIAASIGRLLNDELEVRRPIVVVDGIEVTPLDFIDIGELRLPSNTVPVVIKSLVFA